MNGIAKQCERNRTVEQYVIARSVLANKINAGRSSALVTMQTPRSFKFQVTNAMSFACFLWACDFARNNPDDWEAWIQNPSDPAISQKFDATKDESFRESVHASFLKPPPLDQLFLVMRIGCLFDIFNLSRPSSTPWLVLRTPPISTTGTTEEYRIELFEAESIYRVHIPTGFTNEWKRGIDDLAEKMPSNPLRTILGTNWNKYKSALLGDILSEDTGHTDGRHGKIERTQNPACISPCTVISHVFKVFSIPISLRHEKSRHGKCTALKTRPLLDIVTLAMAFETPLGQHHTLETLSRLEPRVIPAILLHWGQLAQLPKPRPGTPAEQVAGIAAIATHQFQNPFEPWAKKLARDKYGLSEEKLLELSVLPRQGPTFVVQSRHTDAESSIENDMLHLDVAARVSNFAEPCSPPLESELSPTEPSPAELSPTEPSPAELSPMELSPAELSPLSRADLSPAELSPAELSPADLSPAELSPADLSPAELSPSDLSPAELSPAELSPAELSPAELSPAELSPAELSPAELSPAELSPAELSPAELALTQAQAFLPRSYNLARRLAYLTTWLNTMNVALDKSLDEIISKAGPNKKSNRNRDSRVRKPAWSRKRNAVKSGSSAAASATKTVGTAKSAGTTKKAAASVASATNTDMTFYATRVIVSNMPRDVTEAQVEKFFKSELGHISKVVASYNARGQRNGQFTITFTRDGLAAKAMERFNGTVIDNGAAKMKVEIVFDQSAKPLASRLSLKPQANKGSADGANTESGAISQGQKKRLRLKRKKAAAAVAAAAGAAPAPSTESSAGKKKEKSGGRNNNRQRNRPAKTAAELDAEMADYFASGEPAADVIS